MAFKMKGSAFKLGNVATKSALKHSGTKFAQEIKAKDYDGDLPVEKFKKFRDQHDDAFPAGHKHDERKEEIEKPTAKGKDEGMTKTVGKVKKEESPLEQTSDVPRKKIVAPMEGAESTYTEEERKNDPILKKKKKKKEKRNDRGETKAEETKRIAEDKETDRLIRESNKKDFKDKQKKDDARSEKTQKEQEKRNKERSKKHRRDIKREGSLTNLLLGPFEKL